MEREFLDVLGSLGVEQLVTEATRADKVLDLVCCDSPEMVCQVSVLDRFVDSCDHRMVSFEVRGSRTGPEAVREVQKNYGRLDVQAACDYLHANPIVGSNLLDVDDVCGALEQKLGI